MPWPHAVATGDSRRSGSLVPLHNRTLDWGKLWLRIFPTSVRTFRTTAKHLRLVVASPGSPGVENSLLRRLRPRAYLHTCRRRTRQAGVPRGLRWLSQSRPRCLSPSSAPQPRPTNSSRIGLESSSRSPRPRVISTSRPRRSARLRSPSTRRRTSWTRQVPSSPPPGRNSQQRR